MGYRTAAIAGEMPNGLQDRAGLAVRSLARSGMADGRQREAGRKGGKERGISSGRLFSSASALYLPMYTTYLLPTYPSRVFSPGTLLSTAWNASSCRYLTSTVLCG